MRLRTLALFAAGVFIVLPAAGLSAAAETNRPNFIIVFADDQGYQDLGCFGSPDIKTPAAIVGAELDADRPIDGRDVSRLLDDPKAASPHDAVGYYYYKNGVVQAVRRGKWKLHLKKTPELYDLQADIGQRELPCAGRKMPRMV